MRIIILSIAFLFLAISAQSQVLKSAGVWYFLDVDSMTARPAVLPNGTELAYVVGTKTVYYWNRNTSTWTAYGSTFNRDSIYFDASIIGSGTVSDPWGVDSTLFATIQAVGDSILANKQTLSFASPLLGISDGNNVDLSPLLSGYVTGSGTANYVPKWSAITNLTNSNLFDNNTYAGVISRPWKFGEYTTAGLPTGVTGYTVYETTKNGPAWYQGSRWAYGLESTANRLTTGSLIFADANGQATQDNSNLFWDDTNNRIAIKTNVSGYMDQTMTLYGTSENIRFQTSSNNGGSFGFFFNNSINANIAASKLVATPTGSNGRSTLQFWAASSGNATSSDVNWASDYLNNYFYKPIVYLLDDFTIGDAVQTAGDPVNYYFSHNGGTKVALRSKAFGSFSDGSLQMVTNDSVRIHADARGGKIALGYSEAPNYAVDIFSTNALGLPRGPVSTRPTIVSSTTPFRYDTDSTALEYGESAGTWRLLATRAYARSLALSLPTTITTGHVAYSNGTSLVGSANHFWDNTNGFLGIKTATPLQELDINGDAYIRDSTRFTTTPAHTAITGLLTRDATGWVGLSSLAGGLSYSGGVLTGDNLYTIDGTITDPAGRNVYINDSGSYFRLNPDESSKGVEIFVQDGSGADFVAPTMTVQSPLSDRTNRNAYNTNTSRVAYLDSYFDNSVRRTATNNVGTADLYLKNDQNSYLAGVESKIDSASDTNLKALSVLKSDNSTSAGSKKHVAGLGKINETSGSFRSKFYTPSWKVQTQFQASNSYFDWLRVDNLDNDTTSNRVTLYGKYTLKNGTPGTGSNVHVWDNGAPSFKEVKRDTTIFLTADTDYDFSAAITTAQIASRYNRIIIHMTLTSGVGADKTTTLHTPDANLMQCEILIRGTDNTGTYDNEIAFGTNNAISSDGTNTSGYTLAQGQGLHVRVVYNGSAYKYIYY